MKRGKFIIALGGSIAFSEKIDTTFLRKFYLFIKKEIQKGNKFVIICGEGRSPENIKKRQQK